MRTNGPGDLKTEKDKIHWDEFPEQLNPELYETRIDFEAEEKKLVEAEKHQSGKE